MQQLLPGVLAEWLADPTRSKPVLLDVREPWEFALCQIQGSMSMPMGTVTQRLAELDPEQDVVCICHHGMRSYQVAAFLERQGFAEVFNLAGGVAAWAEVVEPTMARY
ncbi:rhodanese-like domain-containing protein [Parachitinimonas caeni]|uniref:Rhodanese-like domain-containing protein n=1 Tax=Parachitinimonas caeni TaxID=3031301 RepID=A0ABT7DVI4_9NEIS|nr:rhodanese-like domain-containing protein [Parachitinimonas caeni]MDK2122652.1 rhodanese-like domain-containing protein [Parachitinimonas caeni]